MYKIILSLSFIFSTSVLSLRAEIYEKLKPDLVSVFSGGGKVKLQNKLERMREEYQGQDNIFSYLKIIIASDEHDFIKIGDLCASVAILERTLADSNYDSGDSQKQADLFEALILGNKEIKNVLVVGRTRGGKSTFLATILNPLERKLAQDMGKESIFSHTIEPSVHWGVFSSGDAGLQIARFIDTPGLTEQKSRNSEMKARSDEEVVKSIVATARDFKIHRVFQIFSVLKDGSFCPQDISAFKLLQESLANENAYDGPFDLIFSNADRVSQETAMSLTKQYVEEILPQKEIDRYTEYTRRGYGAVLLSGTLLGDFSRAVTMPELCHARRVLIYRNLLLAHIFEMDFYEHFVLENGRAKLAPYVMNKIEMEIPEQEIDDSNMFGDTKHL